MQWPKILRDDVVRIVMTLSPYQNFKAGHDLLTRPWHGPCYGRGYMHSVLRNFTITGTQSLAAGRHNRIVGPGLEVTRVHSTMQRSKRLESGSVLLARNLFHPLAVNFSVSNRETLRPTRFEHHEEWHAGPDLLNPAAEERTATTRSWLFVMPGIASSPTEAGVCHAFATHLSFIKPGPYGDTCSPSQGVSYINFQALEPPPSPISFEMVSVTNSFGPLLIGTFFNMILYGILIVQCLFYFQTYKTDNSWIRILVLYLFLVETLNTGCDIAMMYQPLISEYGQPSAVKSFPTLFAAEPVVIVAVSTPIQFFFAWRIWLLTKSIWIPIIISLFAVASFAGGVWTTVMVAVVKLFSHKPELHKPALVWFLSSCISDICITCVLVISLSRRKTGFAATDDAISKIIRMTVQTGLLTALFAIGDVVFFMTLPHTAYNFLWDLALSKLYSNCLLSTLNARSTRNNNSSHVSRARFISGGHGSSTFTRGHLMDSGVEEGHTRQYISSTSLYDLGNDPKERFDASTPCESTLREVGYGITVTKVVERHLEDSTTFPRVL
ncbi:hypothetical protein APHAL10511_000748 [Amanita phalloides]|nr:hypothetical protein APHAL10511_000748 [Amanita phalloides]